MNCVRGGPLAECKPTSRGRIARALWTAEERARQRHILEERLIDAWAWKAQVGAVRDPERPWRLLEGDGVVLVVKPPWRAKHGSGPHYSEPSLEMEERGRLAIEALTWIRRWLKPMAQAPRGSREREKWENFQLWLNYRTHRLGFEDSFNHHFESKAGGNVKLARKLKRAAYRKVERALRVVKLGLFADGTTLEPLPGDIKNKHNKRLPKVR